MHQRRCPQPMQQQMENLLNKQKINETIIIYRKSERKKGVLSEAFDSIFEYLSKCEIDQGERTLIIIW